MHDVFLILQWWFVIFIVGVVFLKLTTKIFSSFFDKGYIFSKILGIAVLSYTVFLLGFLHVLPFTQIITILILGFLFITLGIRSLKIKEGKIRLSTKFTLQEDTPWRIFFFEEVLFLIGLFFWSYIRSYAPEINGLEKFMDFGFINSILRADFFPPKDMWLAPFSINYYYFGHLTAAVLTKLSGITSNISYNLMLATIFGLCFTASFSIGANLVYFFKNRRVAEAGGLPTARSALSSGSLARALTGKELLTGPVIAGLLIAFLVTVSGNLHTVYTFFKPYENEKPVPVWQLAFSPNTFPNSYWYPNATRFIYNTIHEYPIYSWVVADLHGHVLDIPFVLLTIAVLLSLVLNSNIEARNPKQYQNTNDKNSKLFGHSIFDHLSLFRNSNFGFWYLPLIAFLLAVMYMTNAWDGIIYLILSAFVLAYIIFKPQSSIQVIKYASWRTKVKSFVISIILIFAGFILFSLPFSINFKPFVSGIGLLCAPDFLVKMKHLGPFLFEADHCQRSLWWQLLVLYGFFYFFVISFFIFLLTRKNSKHEYRNSKQYQMTKIQNSKRFEHSDFENSNLFRILSFGFRIYTSDIFVILLIIFSTLLIIIPEFIYVKDIYPAHYRANTMFKLVFQSFMMLSIASGYIFVRLISNIKYQSASWRTKIFNFYTVFFIFSFSFFILVMIYPYMAIKSYYGNLQVFKGLDGTKPLKNSYPSDYEAIQWINNNIKGQPVILEAQGDSYTDYGRISANTGLPTVLGWTVHEWLWRGTYDVPSPRIEDVRKLYEEADGITLQDLIKKYGIQYIFLGDLERQKYANINEAKWDSFGKIVFQGKNTKIYQLN